MSKAEERAMEVYPPRMQYTSLMSATLKNKTDANLPKREIYIEGYNQAEKDLGWHSIEESLPPYDEEVIALTDMMHGKQLSSARCICYAHRPNPKGYNGKSIITGKVSHYELMTYNGWNIEGVKYWMPCPKILE